MTIDPIYLSQADNELKSAAGSAQFLAYQAGHLALETSIDFLVPYAVWNITASPAATLASSLVMLGGSLIKALKRNSGASPQKPRATVIEYAGYHATADDRDSLVDAYLFGAENGVKHHFLFKPIFTVGSHLLNAAGYFLGSTLQKLDSILDPQLSRQATNASCLQQYAEKKSLSRQLITELCQTPRAYPEARKHLAQKIKAANVGWKGVAYH